MSNKNFALEIAKDLDKHWQYKIAEDSTALAEGWNVIKGKTKTFEEALEIALKKI